MAEGRGGVQRHIGLRQAQTCRDIQIISSCSRVFDSTSSRWRMTATPGANMETRFCLTASALRCCSITKKKKLTALILLLHVLLHVLCVTNEFAEWYLCCRFADWTVITAVSTLLILVCSLETEPFLLQHKWTDCKSHFLAANKTDESQH